MDSVRRIGTLFAAVACQGGALVVAPCLLVCADEGPDLLCLLFFLFSQLGSCLDLRKPSVSSSEGGGVIVMYAS